MGIQGLLPLLKDVQTPVHVSSYAGKTLGIDAYVWLHRGAYGCAREIVLGDPTPRYIAHALSRIRMLQHFGVKPYLVFDGDKLPAKRAIEDAREQRRAHNLRRASQLEQQGNMQQARDVYTKCVDITPEMAYQLIKSLREQHIPYVVAPYEADAQLAYLEHQRLIDGVITEDSDLLVFGCKTVLFKLDQAGNAIEMLQHRFWSNRHLALSGWTTVEFRQMAILSGCDYLPSIVGLGLKNAHRLLRRYKTIDKVLQAIRLEGKLRIPPTYKCEFRKAELTFVHQRVFDPRHKKLVTLTPLPNGTHDELLPFIGAAMEDHIARGIAEGLIDPIAKTRFVDCGPKSLGLRSCSANNVGSTTSTSCLSGLHVLQRSSTAPSPCASTSTSTTKKKVLTKEPGLQSLKNFFAGSTARNPPPACKPTNHTIVLAPRDTNRISEPHSEPKRVKTKFFVGSEPRSSCAVRRVDHAYLHLDGQMTPQKLHKSRDDEGDWDDECDDLLDFVRSSSPLRSASVVVPQTPCRRRKRVDSGSVQPEPVSLVSSPESGVGSGVISSPASSAIRGADAGCAKQNTSEEEENDDDEEEEVEPVTPLAGRSNGVNRRVLQTSASMSKLEAFRYSTHPPRPMQAKRIVSSNVLGAPSNSPSVLKMTTNTCTPANKTPRPTKMLKRSPTLLLAHHHHESHELDTNQRNTGLFDRFRFSEAAPVCSASASASASESESGSGSGSGSGSLARQVLF